MFAQRVFCALKLRVSTKNSLHCCCGFFALQLLRKQFTLFGAIVVHQSRSRLPGILELIAYRLKFKRTRSNRTRRFFQILRKFPKSTHITLTSLLNLQKKLLSSLNDGDVYSDSKLQASMQSLHCHRNLKFVICNCKQAHCFSLKFGCSSDKTLADDVPPDDRLSV